MSNVNGMLVNAATPPLATNGHANGDVVMADGLKEGTMRFAASGLILPPPDIKCTPTALFTQM
jgi:hypothetical protein